MTQSIVRFSVLLFNSWTGFIQNFPFASNWRECQKWLHYLETIRWLFLYWQYRLLLYSLYLYIIHHLLWPVRQPMPWIEPVRSLFMSSICSIPSLLTIAGKVPWEKLRAKSIRITFGFLVSAKYAFQTDVQVNQRWI